MEILEVGMAGTGDKYCNLDTTTNPLQENYSLQDDQSRINRIKTRVK